MKIKKNSLKIQPGRFPGWQFLNLEVILDTDKVSKIIELAGLNPANMEITKIKLELSLKEVAPETSEDEELLEL